MSAVTEILTTDQIHDLWGAGYTILPRQRHPDPFFVPPELIPQGRAYQWWHLVHDKFHFESPGAGSTGWAPVPASRHDGYFMPFGISGAIEVNGLGLFEKPKFEVDQERASNIEAAHQKVADWVQKTGAEFSGEVKFGIDQAVVGDKTLSEQISDRDIFAVSKSKSIETTVKIPKDMVPHMTAIFNERDRLKGEIVQQDRSLKLGEIADKFYAAVDADKSLPWWPTLHAILLPVAIENVRKSLKQETES